MSETICILEKNSREVYHFSLGEFRGHKFIDVRLFTRDDGREPAPTRKGLAISPHLWPQFRQALGELEKAMIARGWLDTEDLEAEQQEHPFTAWLKEKGFQVDGKTVTAPEE